MTGAFRIRTGAGEDFAALLAIDRGCFDDGVAYDAHELKYAMSRLPRRRGGPASAALGTPRHDRRHRGRPSARRRTGPAGTIRSHPGPERHTALPAAGGDVQHRRHRLLYAARIPESEGIAGVLRARTRRLHDGEGDRMERSIVRNGQCAAHATLSRRPDRTSAEASGTRLGCPRSLW